MEERGRKEEDDKLDAKVLEKLRVMKEEGVPEMESEIRELIRKCPAKSSRRKYDRLLREAMLANAERGKMAMREGADKSKLTKKHMIQTGLTGMARLVKNAASTVDERSKFLRKTPRRRRQQCKSWRSTKQNSLLRGG